MTPLKIDVALVDADGSPAIGGGTWKVTVTDTSVGNNAMQVANTGDVTYTAPSLSVTLNAVSSWTSFEVDITPDRYAPATVKLDPLSSGVLRSDTLVTVKSFQQSAASLELPLLRVREAFGRVPPAAPAKGSSLAGPWLDHPTGAFRRIFPMRGSPVYRELLVNAWLASRSNVTSVKDSSSTMGVFGDPDKDGWDRFNTRSQTVIPSNAGAPMLLEYGEVGTSGLAGPRFLIGLWVPTRSSSAAPKWRDAVAFIHPSTAKTEYPAVAFPFRDPYPYGVGENPYVASSHPDRIYQPYVNLALRYFVGHWSPYHLATNEAILVMPILPHPIPRQPDGLEYGLPFRTPAGMARLLAEVNQFLHRMRYGFSLPGPNAWWGATGPSGQTASSAEEIKPPKLRRVAVAAYSAATPQLDQLLTYEQLSNSRYPSEFWGRGHPFLTFNAFLDAWIETWSLDLLADSSTVPATTFEPHLKWWLDGNSSRRLLMGGSGTTGHAHPDTHYPILFKAAASTISAQSTSTAGRHATFWKGPGADPWKAIFCTNTYLSATTADPSRTPQFPVSPSSDEAHGFMFEVASGFAFGETKVGVP